MNSKRSRHCTLFIGCCLEQQRLNTVFLHLGNSHIIAVSLKKTPTKPKKTQQNQTVENYGYNLSISVLV